MIDINKFKHIPFKTRKQCAVCNTELDAPVIKFPGFPITEAYVKQKVTEKVGFIDQGFHICGHCGHGQLSNVVDPAFLYSDWYSTRTSNSLSAVPAVDVFLKFVDTVLKGAMVKSIVEIGCNDLFMLKKLRDRADKLYGIDPMLRGKENQLRDEKIEVIGDFFENLDIRKVGDTLDVVLSSHTLEHVEEPKMLLKKLLDSATAHTRFFFQFPGLGTLVQNSRFDQIHHQHLHYFSLKSFMHLLHEVGAELIDFQVNQEHWGALMVAFKKKDGRNKNASTAFSESMRQYTNEEVTQQYALFKDCMATAKRRLENVNGEKVYGFGAALMLPVLDYHLGGLEKIECIIDDDKDKEGLYYINVPLQVKSLDAVSDINNAVFFVTAIHSLQTLRAIISRLNALHVKQIIVPVNIVKGERKNGPRDKK